MAAQQKRGKRDVIGKRNVKITAGGIEVVICREAGKTVAYSVAPPEVPIVVEDLQPKSTCKKLVRRNN